MLARWVGFCVRHAALVSLAGLLVAAGCVWLAQVRLGITTDTSRRSSERLPWRQRGMEMDRRFPLSLRSTPVTTLVFVPALLAQVRRGA